MSSNDAAIAATRFGMGARPGEIERIGDDPRGWLKSQLVAETALPAGLAALARSPAILVETLAARKVKRDAKAAGIATEDRERLQKRAREQYLKDCGERVLAAALSGESFRERLVWFWSNHFTVSVRKHRLLPLAGAFEREAIRPHVCGSFGDMLLAVERHPAMLLYLDNAESTGPVSPAGLRGKRGLNENLAREIMELHTLGVDGGYTQGDVEQFARMLTGWGIDEHGGGFAFAMRRHEPGVKTLLGERIASGGQREAEGALERLARHPATARHIATKLARHFIADDPPVPAIERLARVFTESGGNLVAVSQALIDEPAAWSPEKRKLKTPAELVVSTARAAGIATSDGQPLVQAMRQLGQMPFSAESPAGFADRAERWAGPEAVVERLEWCAAAASRIKVEMPLPLLARGVLGPNIARATLDAVGEAPSLRDGLALLLASPDFQWR